MRPLLLFRWMALGALATATWMGCSREKDRWINRTYHQTTARFNPLYNGQVAYDQALTELRETNRDDFTQLISVDDWGRAKLNSPAYQKAKRAVEKANKAIREHSMVFKGKQANPAVFDAYLLMGRAQIIMGLDAPASEALNTVARLSGRAEQQLEAELERTELLARQGNASLAEPLLYELDRKGVPKKWGYWVQRIRGRMAISEQDWPAAAEAMTKASQLAPKADLRARYAFLAAQLYEKASEPDRARTLYEACLKAQPRDYAMLLEAQLRRSLNGGGVSPKKRYQELHDLLREPKNADFADRIYFSLGELATQWDEPDRAYGYYQQSFAAGRAERPMVYGLAYARHGALALERRAYGRAQVDFDSAAIVLPATYSGRDGYQRKAKGLSVLVEALERAELGDSLVRLSRKSEVDVRRQFEEYVAALKKADEAEAERERRLAQLAELRSAGAELDAAAPTAGGAAGGGWAVYAPALRAKGAATFRQKFGERPNVDNWRLRSKSSEWTQQTAAKNRTEKEAGDASSDPEENAGRDSAATEAAKTEEPAGRYDVSGYLAKIPRTPEDRTRTQQEACVAWSDVAAAYRDGMQDPAEAVEAYRRALRSCPDHPEAPRWLYATYRLHVGLSETLQADAALKELLERYPNSEPAQIVRKGSTESKVPQEPAASPEFRALHDAVKRRDWKEAVRIHQASAWSESERAPAALLHALAVGGQQGKTAYADALRAVSATFPNTPQAAAAQTYLVALSTVAAPEPAVNPDNLKLFTPAPQAPHQVVLLFPTGFDANAVRNALARIHSTNYPEKPLGVRTLPWNENLELICVDGFANAAEALTYRDAMRQNADLRKLLPAERTTFWPVTVANFSHLYRSKDDAAYRLFVQRQYGLP